MAIDINGLPSPRRADTAAKQAERAASNEASTRTSAQTRSQDAVSLTEQAKQLGKLQQSMSQSPVVDQQRVQALRKAISEGQYKVDPDKLAKAMATLEQDLFGDVEVESR